MSLTSSNDCNSLQTFCALNVETVGQNLDIDNLFPSINQGTKINLSTLTSIKDLFRDIYDYGNEGTRNPTLSEINEIPDNPTLLLLSDYNKILQILKQTDILNTAVISLNFITNLKQYIKDYKLNNDRCNYCNVAVNCSQGPAEGCACVGDGYVCPDCGVCSGVCEDCPDCTPCYGVSE